MNKFVMAALLCMALISTGCSQAITKQDVGLGIGAAAGAMLGHTVGKGEGREIATVAGAIAGAYLGSAIGKYMDTVDRAQVNRTLEKVPDYKANIWTNQNTSIRYAVTPTRTYGGETPCREYTTQAVIGGRTETVYGTACRQKDGSWRASL